MNIAYKHLDSKLRIGELTIGQWVSVALGVGVAGAWVLYIHPPLGATLTVVTAVYLGALPAGAALLAGSSEFNLFVILRSALRWRRHRWRFVPGPGDHVRGYVLHQDPANAPREARRQAVVDLDTTALWEDQ
ncbi:hypothetical protein DSM104299_00523 [Baekduia alba]|uniref:hypothetical protein n=1 Tax=Baekduia alba TaxID=2997333 RepID=UPI00234041E4|nr:hypothetical protein [Baekduia alba]WCB91845.1 hypothetical protein DSM104299_00523 [Baekduia alba]